MSLLPRAAAVLLAPARRLPALLSVRGEASSSSAAAAAATASEGGQAAAAPAGEAAAADAPTFDMANPFQPERRRCLACRHGLRFSYRNVKLLSQFVSPFTGRMYGRHVTGLCAEQYRRLESEYKKAVACGYMAVLLKEVDFLRDPKICDPTSPVRPHRF